jgi:hypothetical protein
MGVRCFGYLDSSGSYARCTREEKAGNVPQNRDGTYSHRLHGTCRCAQTHGEALAGHPLPGSTPTNPRRPAQQRFRSYFTLAAFLKKRYGDGTTVTPWIYRDATGREAFRVLRIDYKAADGARRKSYRPCHQAEDGRWHLATPRGLLPLYNLPAILSAPAHAIITVLEGEKCTDIAMAIGLPHATTSAHGAKAPQLTDWSQLAGRPVAILGDSDADGMAYVTKVAALLAALDPAAEVRIVGLPGLSEGEDIEQWIAARRAVNVSDAEILSELIVLIDAAAPAK